jgi:regulator of replication initiation timing
LFVPKDERKISNVVKINNELNENMGILRLENKKMRTQLEEILERGALAK